MCNGTLPARAQASPAGFRTPVRRPEWVAGVREFDLGAPWSRWPSRGSLKATGNGGSSCDLAP
jgi:hypothetical protein